MTYNFHRPRMVAVMLLLIIATGLSACGLVALPFRATGAALKVVPVAGHVAAAPLDATANVID